MKESVKALGAERLGLTTIMLLGYALRLLWVHNPGCVPDSRIFADWMRSASQGGINLVLENEKTAYPPVTMYALWALGELLSPQEPDSANATIVEMIGLRLLTVYFDVLTIAVICRIGKRAGSRPITLTAALVYATNPVAVYLSGWWGQIDAWFTLPLVLAVWWLSLREGALAWIMLSLAVLLKQPAIIALPLAIVATYRWMGWRRLGTGLAICATGLLSLTMPVVPPGRAALYLERLAAARKIFPWISLRSYNLWYLLTPRARGISLDLNHDHGAFIGGISFHDWGLLLLATGYALLLTRVLTKARPRDLLAACGICWLAYFTTATRIHARYVYPAMVLFLLAGQFNRRWLWIYIGLTATATLNVFSRACEVSPTTCLPPFLASGPLSLAAAAVNVALLVLAFVLFFHQTSHAIAWKGIDAVRFHKALIRLSWAVFIGLTVLTAYTANRLDLEAASVAVALSESLDKYASQVEETSIVVNFPREIKTSPTGVWQVLPVTPPSQFLPPDTKAAPGLVYLQYDPWQVTPTRLTRTTCVQYHGHLAGWAELTELAQRAGSIAAVNPYSHQVYSLAESVRNIPTHAVLFGDSVILVEATAVVEDECLVLVLGWRATGRLSADTTVFVHLLNETGTVISQADGAPGRGLFPLAYLASSGITLRETRIMPTTLDPVEVLVGIYEQDSLSRLPVYCSAEQSCTTDALRIRLRSQQ